MVEKTDWLIQLDCHTIACRILSFNIIYALSAFLGKVSNDFQNVLVIIIAKLRLMIYFFTFVLAIFGVLTHLKMGLLTTFFIRLTFRTTPLKIVRRRKVSAIKLP